MAREAAVKLTLDSGSYTVTLKRVGEETEKAAKQATTAWDRVKAGAGKLGASYKELGGKAKDAAMFAGTLGGAFSLGGAVMQSVNLQSTLADLAFSTQLATGQATSWRDIQTKLAPVALQTSRTTEEMAEAFRAVLDETGNAKLAEESLLAIGTAATATGRSTGEMAGLVGVLNEKFGVTAAEVPDALAALVELSSKGGVGFEDLERVLAMTGASAKSAGLDGEAGFRRMIAMANVADDALGTSGKGIKVITGLLDQMAGPELQKKIKTSFGVNVTDAQGKVKDLGRVMGEIFSKTGGDRKKLQAAFGDEQVKFLQGLAQPFQETFAATEGTVKKKTKAAMEALDKALEEGGASALKFGDLQAQAAKRAEDPQRQMARAMETLSQEFTKPEIVNAIRDFAKQLPKLAKVLAQVIDFAAKNPKMAAALVMGGHAGGVFGMGAAGAGGGGGGGGGVGGMVAATALSAGMKAGGTKLMAVVAANPAWRAAGMKLGAAAAPLLAAAMVVDQVNKLEEATTGERKRAIAAGAVEKGGILDTLGLAGGLQGIFEQGLGGLTGGLIGGKGDEEMNREARAKARAEGRLQDPTKIREGTTTVEHVRGRPAATPAKPMPVKLDPEAGGVFAKSLQGTTLRVIVERMPAQGGASRGTPVAPPAAPGAGSR